ncbi:MAG: hypothetical protein ACQGVK_03815 [Myxococcota bacterium]
MIYTRLLSALVALSLPLVAGTPVRAKSLDSRAILDSIGFTKQEIADARAGKIIRRSLDATNERELVAAMAFLVREAPDALMARTKQGLLTEIDPNTLAWGTIEGKATEASFSELSLRPDPEKRAKRYAEAEPGDDLNLSREEIAAFAKLGADAAPADIEAAVRRALAARVEAYRASGLAGIAPYARSKREERSVAAELRSATQALDRLEQRIPSVAKFFLEYPQGRPEGTEELYLWSQIEAHGVPTILLTHSVAVPEGDAWVAMQRQYYVSEGYNCEEAVAVFLPVENGTAVVYVNRTSTDQVAGFGGGAKRSIGSRMLASQLEGLFHSVQAGATD